MKENKTTSGQVIKQKTICQQLNLNVEEGKPFKIRDQNNNLLYYETGTGFWVKREFDQNNNEIYMEDSDGFIRDDRVKELTLDEIADKFGIKVENLKIKK